MSLTRYALMIGGVSAASLAIARPFLGTAADAVAAGAVLAAANTLLAHGSFCFAERRSPNVFLGVVLGGMVSRLILMVAAILLGIWGLGLAPLPFVLAVAGYFSTFLLLELSVLHRHSFAQPEAR